MARTARKGGTPAPYTKYGKRPHRYSSLFHEWQRAKRDGKDALAAELGRQLSERAGMKEVEVAYGEV